MDRDFQLGAAEQDYENIRPLNSKAGMSDLFLAHKKGMMDLDVVIKRVQREVQAKKVDPKNESEILKKLKHQYLPRIYDIIQGEDGYIYTVMDFIRGKNLNEYVKANGPITQKQVHRWGCQLCEVVEYLQQEKDEKPVIIHCDIKPGNVMITESGDICLIDFGTSLICKGNMQKTAFLSPGYAAPEQYFSAQTTEPACPSLNQEQLCRGEETILASEIESIEKTVKASGEPNIQNLKNKEGISKATDIYAIGATLYFAVTGKSPEDSRSEVTPIEKLNPPISEAMVNIIARAMSKKPEQRFQDATQMLQALNDVAPMDRDYKRYVLQKRVMALLLTVTFVISACSTGYGFYLMRLERENNYLNIISRAEEAKEKNQYEESRRLLESAIQQQPTRADAYINLAVLLYQQGNYQAAIDSLKNAVDSGNLDLENIKGDTRGEFYYVQGCCLLELKSYEKAIDSFLESIAASQGNIACYRSLAIAQVKNNQLKEAEETLKILVSFGAASGDCDIVRAELAEMQGKYLQAIQLYEQVFEEVTDQQLLSHAYLSAAQACEAIEDLERAVRILEKAQKDLGEERSVLQREMLVDLYGKLAIQFPDQAEKYYKKAETVLEKLIRSGKGTLITNLNMASIQQALENYGKAEEYLLDIQQLYPFDYQVDMRLAYLYIDWQSSIEVEQRDYQDAWRYYKSAKEKYQKALANGLEDQNMIVLANLIEQLQTVGWINEE